MSDDKNTKPGSTTSRLSGDTSLRSFVQGVSVGACFISDGVLTFNPIIAAITGYSPNEITTVDAWFKKLCGDESQAVASQYHTDRKAGFPLPDETTLHHKDGGQRHVQIARYANGKEEVWLIFDVTRYEETETSLRESEARFRSLTELSAGWYWEQDEQFRFTKGSGGSFDSMDLRPPEDIGKTRWELPIVDVTAAQWKAHKALLNAHKPFYDLEFKRVTKDGETRDISVSGQPFYDRNGKFKGYRGIARDITERKEAEESLRESEARFRSLSELSADWYWEQDKNYRFTMKSGIELDKASLHREEDIGKTRWELPIFGVSEEQWAAHRALLDARKPFFDLEYKRQDADGVIHYISISGHPFFDTQNNFKGYRGIARDITTRKQDEEALRESERRFRSLTELSADWYWEQDEQFRFTQKSGGNRETNNLRPDEDIGKTRWELPLTGVTDEQWIEHKRQLVEHLPFHNFEFQRVDAKGEMHHISISGQPFYDNEGNFRGYRGIGRDITEQKKSEARIEYLAYHDILTGLPNRALFQQRISHALAQARRYHKILAVLFIDLDRFKNINDTLGHDAGDILLQETSRRLLLCLRESDTVARLGGDEFVVLLENVSDPKYIAGVGRKILGKILEPFTIKNYEYRVTASIGISTYPNDGIDEQSLMKNADIAMYLAKDHGRNNYQFYSTQLNIHSFERLSLESNLRRALENDEFVIHYQTKLDIETGKITGMEALLRWQHPDLGLVMPAQFILLAEENGLIIPIGKWVLHTACRQNKAWQDQGLSSGPIAVNLSARQFNDEHLLHDINAILTDTGLDPALLEIEITESMVMHNAEKAIKLLTDLRAIGVTIAIDDFGIGYSSLAHLKKFPIDRIKVDRSFIQDIVGEIQDGGMTQAIIAMGKTLKLTVIAEGVETMEQLGFLRDNACDQAQGFYFSSPVSAEECSVLLRDHVAVPNPNKKTSP